jgi:hypothetical protein
MIGYKGDKKVELHGKTFIEAKSWGHLWRRNDLVDFFFVVDEIHNLLYESYPGGMTSRDRNHQRFPDSYAVRLP